MITAIPGSAKVDFLSGTHQPGDVYKLALYSEAAVFGTDSKVYSALGEIKADGYKAGGKIILGFSVKLDGLTAILSFATVIWENATITARGAVIYNSSKGNKLLAVWDFLKDKNSTDDNFKVKMPPATAKLGLIRFT